ncbi:unnamed protein product, partial [Medioppia subpectinata]
IGAFAEAIQSWHRLIDIKNQYIDDKIAGILVNALCEGIVDRNGESTAKLAVKMQELFGRIAATSSGSTTIWRLYAKLLINNKEKDIEKVIQCLQKCHRNAVQTNDWQKEPKLIVETLKHCLLLADEYHECAVLDTTKALRVLSSSKLAINSVVVLVEKTRGDWSQTKPKCGSSDGVTITTTTHALQCDRNMSSETTEETVDPDLVLSEHTLNALKEFYEETNRKLEAEDDTKLTDIEENWQLSQFWYTEDTARYLCDEVMHALGVSDDPKTAPIKRSIACISCPTLFDAL